ncbi:hypothetical protein NMG60_11006181 [Bertholletia excelsa]
MIEYLDLQYGRTCKSRFNAWSRMPINMTSEKLITEVIEEVRRWTLLAGKIPDEIVEEEMSHSTGIWTDFEPEAYQAGAEIDRDLLQILVDEVVMDLCGRKTVSRQYL